MKNIELKKIIDKLNNIFKITLDIDAQEDYALYINVWSESNDLIQDIEFDTYDSLEDAGKELIKVKKYLSKHYKMV